MTITQAQRALAELVKGIDRATVNGIRRGLNYWRTLTVEGIRSRGVGRAIWTKKLTSLRPIVSRLRVTKSGNGYQAGLKLRGLAALQEVGGKTAAHQIQADTGSARIGKRFSPAAAAAATKVQIGYGGKLALPRLAFMGRIGWVRPFTVRHPGSQIPAQPSARPAAAAAAARAAQEVETGLTIEIARAGLR